MINVKSGCLSLYITHLSIASFPGSSCHVHAKMAEKNFFFETPLFEGFFSSVIFVHAKQLERAWEIRYSDCGFHKLPIPDYPFCYR